MIPGPGGLCDQIVVSTKDLFLIPDGISYEEASLTEPLACCVHSIEIGDIQLGDDVVVIGGGIMGINHVMLAKRKGERVISLDENTNIPVGVVVFKDKKSGKLVVMTQEKLLQFYDLYNDEKVEE